MLRSCRGYGRPTQSCSTAQGWVIVCPGVHSAVVSAAPLRKRVVLRKGLCWTLRSCPASGSRSTTAKLEKRPQPVGPWVESEWGHFSFIPPTQDVFTLHGVSADSTSLAAVGPAFLPTCPRSHSDHRSWKLLGLPRRRQTGHCKPHASGADSRASSSGPLPSGRPHPCSASRRRSRARARIGGEW